ncbi:DUF3099 domain-containing protein [Brevibacterium spongiae]|uniref:DUF3099 domain-containing protein n=1 Tax=Brevibacterium spongiae TaxID=2909672 RepID=A0ABY5SIQ4_9MICO|nr:DUF3099 domain-containing protein [Brevibacterium spongiae]UVI34433.1 DUF3099 domain-containing protein [Brevibacterium spongiae]
MFGSHRSKKDMVKHSQQITTADTALDDDMRSRIIKYSITMGIRTACFVAAYFAFAADRHILMWICVAGAVILPYPAVIFANAGRERTTDEPSTLLDQAPLAQLPPARGETIGEDGTVTDTVAGETVDDPDPEAATDHEGTTDEHAAAEDHATAAEDHGTAAGETIAGETIDDHETVAGETIDDHEDRGENA